MFKKGPVPDPSHESPDRVWIEFSKNGAMFLRPKLSWFNPDSFTHHLYVQLNATIYILILSKSQRSLPSTSVTFPRSSKAPVDLLSLVYATVFRFPFISLRSDYSHSFLIISHSNPRGAEKKLRPGHGAAFKWTDDQIKWGVSGLRLHSDSCCWHFTGGVQYGITWENCKLNQQMQHPDWWLPRSL